MSNTHFGIDVGKSKLDCALQLPGGQCPDTSGPNSPEGLAALHDWLVRHGGGDAHVCMEATNTYWEDVAQFFAERGHVVSVVNPAQIKAHAGACLSRSKTDAIDARRSPTSAPSTTRRLGSRAARPRSPCAPWCCASTPCKPC